MTEPPPRLVRTLACTLAAALVGGGLASAWAQNVALVGVSAGRAVLLINGAAPRLLAPGQSANGVRLLQLGTDTATIEVAGERRVLQLGGRPIAPPQTDTSRRITLLADSAGHFLTLGQIHGQSVPLLVDTGATAVTLSEAQAQRLGLDYRKGTAVRVRTANGDIVGHQIQLNSLRVGEHTSHNVPAVVLPTDLPHVLLGNSYLSRFRMQREDNRMTLDPRY